MTRIIPVRGHYRTYNGKRRWVDSHNRSIEGKKKVKMIYKNYLKGESRITADNISFMQYEILDYIDWFGKKYGPINRKEILNHFDDDEIWIIDDAIANCRSQGLINPKNFKITELGMKIKNDFKKKEDDFE